MARRAKRREFPPVARWRDRRPWRIPCSRSIRGTSRRDSGAAISFAVTSLAAHRIKPTLVSTSDDQLALKASADGPDRGALANEAGSEDLFDGYGRHLAYDEMFDGAGAVRPHCAAVFDELRRSSSDELGELQLEAGKAFLTQGITFTVFGDEQCRV